METIILAWDDGQATPIQVESPAPKTVEYRGIPFLLTDTKVDGCAVYNKEFVIEAEPVADVPFDGPSLADFDPPSVSAGTIRAETQDGFGSFDAWGNRRLPMPTTQREYYARRDEIHGRILREIDAGTAPFNGYRGNGCDCNMCRASGILNAYERGEPVASYPNLSDGRWQSTRVSLRRAEQWIARTFNGFPTSAQRQEWERQNEAPRTTADPSPDPWSSGAFSIQRAADQQRLAGQRMVVSSIDRGEGRITWEELVNPANTINAPTLPQPMPVEPPPPGVARGNPFGSRPSIPASPHERARAIMEQSVRAYRHRL